MSLNETVKMPCFGEGSVFPLKLNACGVISEILASKNNNTKRKVGGTQRVKLTEKLWCGTGS